MTTRADSPTQSENLNLDAARGATDPSLRQLLSDHWEFALREAPVWATRIGEHRWDRELGDPSPAHKRSAAKTYQALLDRAHGLSATTLSREDRLTLALLTHELEVIRRLETIALPWSWQISSYENAITFINEISENHQVNTPADAEALVARYRAVPVWVEGYIAALREGLVAGRVAPAPPTVRLVEMLARQLGEPVETWTLFEPTRLERGWKDADKDAFARSAEAALREAVAPALSTLHAFLVGEILPAARGEDRVGVCFLPDGEAVYQAFVLQHASIERDAASIHQTGLEELARIHAEIRALGLRLFQTDDLGAIFKRLREDPDLRFSTAQEVEDKAREALARARDAMPRWFGRLPVTDCVVRRVPDYQAPYTTIAYYRPPGGDGASVGQPGEYMINTYAPETRPRFEAEALAFHESIPGHHHQIALAMELPNLPAFRRFGLQNAYVEGWALYTERLADEMGLYSGDLDRMGMLSFDTWRASRLVVDTGLHALGWDAARAVAFLLANTPLAENNIRNEVDRYISWPGQALGYKLGQIVVQELRAEAEKTLGAAFRIAEFHDVLLCLGPVPLVVLEQEMRRWMKREESPGSL